jgi:hypothetical protein
MEEKQEFSESVIEMVDELITKFSKECHMSIAGAYTIWRPLVIKQCVILCDTMINEYEEINHITGRLLITQSFWRKVKSYLQSLK